MTEEFQQDIKHLLFTEEFFFVVAHSLYLPDKDKLRVVAERYNTNDCLKIAGYFIDGKLVGCAGMALSDPDKAGLHHLAVDPAYRGRGIGRKLIEGLAEWSWRRRLMAKRWGFIEAVGL